MADVAESSSAPNDKPVIVRVKRKAFQSPLDAFWLEISDRPLKRPLIDFEKLSISASSANEELKSRRIFVQHVETVKSTEASIDILQSFVEPGADNVIKFSDRGDAFKRDKKPSELLAKAKQEQETLARNARFEQIWRSRRDKKEAIQDEAYRLYDIVRVDSEQTSRNANVEKDMSLEDQESLCKVLPLLRELIPTAADEIESDMSSYVRVEDEFVYDLYAVNEDVNEMDASFPFPLVQVDDDGFCDGPDHSDYETDDSNAENHPWNDYPDEESDEEEESRTSGSESDELASETNSKESAILDDSGITAEDEMNNSDCSYGDYDELDHTTEEGGDDEDWRWAYR
ncbi:hypothetical protein Ancab_011701 [Ancistrocladus abbreviatus]